MAKSKSGKSWVTWANTHAKGSSSIEELEGTFKTNLNAFKKALEDAGAKVEVESTKRSKKRAYLFHWSWKISLGKCKPKDATAMTGVDIQWDHGDLAKSKAGAKEMVSGFNLAVPPKSNVAPSLTSNHIAGKAIDMKISWDKTKKLKIKKKDGTEVEVPWKENVNLNTALHGVGATYSVKKHTGDKPHWSHNAYYHPSPVRSEQRTPLCAGDRTADDVWPFSGVRHFVSR